MKGPGRQQTSTVLAKFLSLMQYLKRVLQAYKYIRVNQFPFHAFKFEPVSQTN